MIHQGSEHGVHLGEPARRVTLREPPQDVLAAGFRERPPAAYVASLPIPERVQQSRRRAGHAGRGGQS